MKTVNKPWGKEEILEINDHYMVKRLSMKQGCRCSSQYHRYKVETIIVVSGILLVTINNTEDIILNPGDHLTILPRTVHRMEGKERTVYLECSTPEIDDVVRLEDDYGRE